jgi:hypothetical protein
MLGLFISVLLNVMLLCKFGFDRDKPEMMWHSLPVLLYFTTGLVQMVVLFLKPKLHQQHRFPINVANRILKAITVTWAAVNMSDRSVMQHFTGTLNSVPLGGIAGVHSTAAYMKVLRTVASLPLLCLSHAVNFMLPFWLLLPLQLYTLLAVSKVIPAIVCVLLGQPPHILQPAAVMAAHVGWFVRAFIAMALPLPCSWPWELGWGGGGGVGVSLDAVSAQELLLLVAVTFTMVSDAGNVMRSVSSAWRAACLWPERTACLTIVSSSNCDSSWLHAVLPSQAGCMQCCLGDPCNTHPASGLICPQAYQLPSLAL